MASSVGAVAISTEREPGFAWIEIGEPASAEHFDHPVILREHFGLERPDPYFIRGLDEVADQERTETRALELVGDAHAQLRPGRVLPDELCASHHVPGIATRHRQQREVIWIFGQHRLGGQARHVDRHSPESESSAFIREADQVVLDGSLIL